MIKRLLRTILLAMITISMVMGGFGCGDDNEKHGLGSTWEEILTLARDEGVVTIYTGLDTVTTVHMLASAMQEYGIVLRNQSLHYREIMDKLQVEAAANVPICDIAGVTLGYMLSESNSDYWEDYRVLPNIEAITSNGEETNWKIAPNHYPYGYVYHSGTPRGIAFNINNIDTAGIASPHSWEDLASEDYYGKIVMSDPAIYGSGFSKIAAQLYYGPMGINGTEVFDREWLKGVLKNMYISDGVLSIENGLVHGQHTIHIPANLSAVYMDLAQDNTHPVGWRYPDEGAYLTPTTLIPIKNARHPNAAAVLLNYIFSEAGQMAIAAGMSIPVMEGLDIQEQYMYAGSDWGNYADFMYEATPLDPYPQDVSWVEEKEKAIVEIINEIKEELQTEGEWNNYQWIP